MYPGCGTGGVAGRGYTGYYPAAIPGSIFNIYLRLGPTHGQMKVNYEVSQTGSQIGSRYGPELTRIDPISTLQDRSRDGPEMGLR